MRLSRLRTLPLVAAAVTGLVVSLAAPALAAAPDAGGGAVPALGPTCGLGVNEPTGGGSAGAAIQATARIVCSGVALSGSLDVHLSRGNVVIASKSTGLAGRSSASVTVSVPCDASGPYSATAAASVPGANVPQPVVNSGTVQIDCGAPPASHDPFGRLEVVENNAAGYVHVSGWAIDPDSTASVPVVIYIDGPGGGVLAGVFNADLSRPDLAATYPQAGPNHGFDRNGPSDIYPPEPDLWPWAPLPGDFDVCAWASNVGAGAHNVEIGCGHLHITY